MLRIAPPLKRTRRTPARYQPSSSKAGIGDDGSVAPVKMDPFLRKKLKLRWTNGDMLDAIITNYNPTSEDDKPFCVLYRPGEAEEETEWLNLKYVGDNDIQWDGDPPEIP